MSRPLSLKVFGESDGSAPLAFPPGPTSFHKAAQTWQSDGLGQIPA